MIFRVLIFTGCLFSHMGWCQASWQTTYARVVSSYENYNLDTALQLGQEALLQAKNEYGYNSRPYAETLRLLTLVAYAGNYYDAGIDYNWEELTILELTGNSESTEYANALSNLAMLYFSLDSVGLAQKYYEKALVLFSNQAETLPKGYALAVYSLANIYIEKGQQTKADSLYTKLIHMYDQLQAQSWYYAGALYNKALLTGTHQAVAQQMLEKALQIFREEQATNRSEYAQVLYQIATNQWQQQNFNLADSLFDELMEWYEQAADTLNPYYSSALNNRGLLAQASGKTERAVHLLEKAHAIRNSVLAANSPEYLTSSNNLAKIYLQSGQPEKAEDIYFSLLNNDTLEMPWQAAMLWESWAVKDAENGKYLEASRKFLKSKSIYANILNQQDVEIEARYASLLYYLGQNYQSLGKYDSAQLHFKEALTLYEKISGKNSATYASLLAGLGALYQDMGNLSAARSAFEEALQIQASAGGENTNAFAGILSNYALLYQEMGNYQQAETLLRKALLIKRAALGGEHPEYMAVLSNLGLLYVETGDYALAAPMLEKSLAFYKNNYETHGAEAATSLINLALLKQATGKYTEAEPLLKEAISLRKEMYGGEHPAYAGAINGLALFYQTMGNYTASEPLLLEAREVYRNRYGTSHPDYAALTQNLATLYQITDKPAQAERLLIETLQIDKQVLGDQHPDYAVVLSNLASHYEASGNYVKAEPLLLEALAVNKATFGGEHPAYASTLYNLAVIYSEMNQLDTAELLFQQVVHIRENMLGPQHPDYAQGLYGLAVLYHKKGDFEKAYPLFKEVIGQYTRQIKTYFPALSEKEKSAFFRRIEPVMEAYKSFVIELAHQQPGAMAVDPTLKDSVIADLYNAQLTTKALLLDASSRVRQQILNSGDEDLKRLFENWTQKKEYLVNLYSKSSEELKKENIDIQLLEKRANEIEKELSSRSTLFSGSLNNQQPSWADVQNTLAEDEAAIEIVRVRQQTPGDSLIYAALVITPALATPGLVVLPEGKKMEKKYFNYFRNSVKFRIKDTLSYSLFWKPIDEILPHSTKTVYLSPDGIYNKINLHVLSVPETGSYVLDRYAIRLLSSTRDLLPGMKQAEIAQKKAYLFGYPDYNLDAEPGQQGRLQEKTGQQKNLFSDNIDMLPGTKTEVNDLYKLLQENAWNAKKYMGKSAREEKVKSIRSPKLLHIATHGFFLSDLEVSTKTGQKAYGIHLDNIKVNPLLRSGLLFAGASNTIRGYAQSSSDVISALATGDGILTAYEVMNMDLDGTDLVILSACETGLGEIKNGEGVYGLQRAFLVAGAQSIIMSLWKVEDEATAKLMEHFYQHWVMGEDKHEAFIHALRSFKQEYPEPYYWGGFVMVGK